MNKQNSLLIVDDDALILAELIHILEPEYNITAAKNGISAIKRTEKVIPDLILLDVIMPDMNGFDVLAELKRNDRTKNIPVIFITGISEDEKESAGLSIGAVDFIRKPFDEMVVKLRVRHQIKIVNLQRELETAVRTAETANQTKSTFLANMSHEIRTPMNAILGITEILIQDDDLPEEVIEGLGRIFSSCDLLLGIINDILDFSKIEAGKLDVIPARYVVAGMINDSVHLNMMRINNKPIEFVLDINEKIPAKLIGDELRIKQVLNNLLSNAFKYTDAGTVTLSVDVKPAERKDQITLVLRVSDTGHGMTNEQLGRLFEEYSRFNNEKNAAVEGTGLGLAITKRLVNLMHANLHVESEVDKGSSFTVQLLQGIVDKDVLGKETAENLRQFRVNYSTFKQWGNIAREAMPYGSVMIVDDVETNLYVAAGLLKLYKLRIDTAMSGQEIINKIKEGSVYDIIFMDHMMPDMDGIEVTKILRDNGYTSPIVALTANAVAGQSEIFMQNGFDDFISKPIDIRQLDAILSKLIRDKYPAEAAEASRLKQLNPALAHSDDAPAADTMLIKSFIRDAGKAVDWMDEHDMLKELPQENPKACGEILKKFTIMVHGMKSSLWNIGEKELSALAFQLEVYGREENTVMIGKTAPVFFDKLRGLLDKFKTANDKQVETADEDIEDIKNKLFDISMMCDEFNRKGIIHIVNEIKNCSKETRAVLDSILEHVLHSEFDDAKQEADTYIINHLTQS